MVRERIYINFRQEVPPADIDTRMLMHAGNGLCNTYFYLAREEIALGKRGNLCHRPARTSSDLRRQTKSSHEKRSVYVCVCLRRSVANVLLRRVDDLDVLEDAEAFVEREYFAYVVLDHEGRQVRVGDKRAADAGRARDEVREYLEVARAGLEDLERGAGEKLAHDVDGFVDEQRRARAKAGMGGKAYELEDVHRRDVPDFVALHKAFDDLFAFGVRRHAEVDGAEEDGRVNQVDRTSPPSKAGS